MRLPLYFHDNFPILPISHVSEMQVLSDVLPVALQRIIDRRFGTFTPPKQSRHYNVHYLFCAK